MTLKKLMEKLSMELLLLLILCNHLLLPHL
jgi:hypothetical protein